MLPSRAHQPDPRQCGALIELIAGAFSELLAGLTHGLDNDALHRIQDGIGAAVTALHAMGQEAERERAAHLSSGPDTGPLLRTILRLRHDVVMIGRECGAALPANVQARLAAPLSGVSEAIVAHLRAAAARIAQRRRAAGDRARAMRVAGLCGGGGLVAPRWPDPRLPGDVAERFFALGFSLEQMRQNLGDLDRCVAEWSEKAAGESASRAKASQLARPQRTSASTRDLTQQGRTISR